MTAPSLCCIVGGVAEMFPVINNSWPCTLESHCGKLSVCRDTAAAGVISLHRTTTRRLELGTLHLSTSRGDTTPCLQNLKFFTVSHPFLPILTHILSLMRVFALNFYDFHSLLPILPGLSIPIFCPSLLPRLCRPWHRDPLLLPPHSCVCRTLATGGE